MSRSFLKISKTLCVLGGMKEFDQHTFFRMSPPQKAHYVGFVTTVQNNYLAFETGEEQAYADLNTEIIKNGRKSVDFSKYEAVEKQVYTPPSEEGQDFLKHLPKPDGEKKNPKVLKILEKISQPKGRLTLQESRVLFLELFKNYKN